MTRRPQSDRARYLAIGLFSPTPQSSSQRFTNQTPTGILSNRGVSIPIPSLFYNSLRPNSMQNRVFASFALYISPHSGHHRIGSSATFFSKVSLDWVHTGASLGSLRLSSKSRLGSRALEKASFAVVSCVLALCAYIYTYIHRLIIGNCAIRYVPDASLGSRLGRWSTFMSPFV